VHSPRWPWWGRSAGYGWTLWPTTRHLDNNYQPQLPTLPRLPRSPQGMPVRCGGVRWCQRPTIAAGEHPSSN